MYMYVVFVVLQHTFVNSTHSELQYLLYLTCDMIFPPSVCISTQVLSKEIMLAMIGSQQPSSWS